MARRRARSGGLANFEDARAGMTPPYPFRFMGGEQVRTEHGAPHEPQKISFEYEPVFFHLTWFIR